jgi:glyoxylase I family protein
VLEAQCFHHVAVSVTDLGRAKAFYSGVLGLQEIPRPYFPVDGTWYQLGEGQLHLIVYPPTHTLRGTTAIDIREGHVALRVATTYQETVDHLRAHGLEVFELPDNSTPWKQIYVTDPDGNIVEFNVERT